MKILLHLSILLLSVNATAQTNDPDSLNDQGIAKYREGNKTEALRLWEIAERVASKKSVTYGLVLENILTYCYETENETKLLEYYGKIMNSKLNDKDRNVNGLGDMFMNYRYNSTMRIANYYDDKKQYAKALNYLRIADEKLTFEETSLTSIIVEKTRLALLTKQAYLHLGKTDSAFFVLIKRAFEYDYKKMYKNWATLSPNKGELRISEAIVRFDSSKVGLQRLKSEIDSSLINLKIKYTNGSNYISFSLRHLNYDIVFYQNLNTVLDCKKYLEDSFFYQYLLNRIQK